MVFGVPMRACLALLLLLLLLLGACRTGSPPGPAASEERTDLEAILDATGFAGTALLYDLHRDRLYAVHGERADERRLPASTFKIANTLAALDAGLVEDENTVLPWDGEVHPAQPAWNRDLSLRYAFRASAVPHFQGLARRLGPERMQAALDRLGYGNRDISGGIDRFWLDGGLRISPREQLDFLVRLYRNQLPVSVRAQETVKRVMLDRETEAVRIRAKTGWAMRVPVQVGWWVGWVERGDDVYFFVTSLVAERPDPARFLPARIEVTERMLDRLGWLPPRADAEASR
jgi:beta-lactamase class D